MVIAYDADAVTRYMRQAVEYSQERPVLVDHFLENAIEVDVDALCDSKDVLIAGIMQHIEEAGIHSGDSSCVLPAVEHPRRDSGNPARLHAQAGPRAQGRRPGQSAVRHPARRSRATTMSTSSRSIRAPRAPFLTSPRPPAIPLAKIAARLMTGRTLRELLPDQARLRQGSRNRRALLRQVAGLPLVEVRRRRYGSRARR